VFGNLIVAVVDTIINVAQYTGFTNAPAVLKGWTIVRDVTNMFFIVIMLYIAFRTMFGQEANWQSSLIRLLIAAIVINFSRTICGLIIDASQVVMITFVNGMKDAAGGNFIDMLQLRQMLQQPATTGSDVFFFSVLALIMSFCSLVIITLLLVFLVVRIIFLWLIILSPLAFFLKLSPIGGDMWGKWWSRFKEQVLTGPILAFFLWLSLLTTQETNNDVLAHGIPNSNAANTLVVPVLGNVNLQGYIVGLAMLVVSMMAARAVGGETFSIADKYAGFNSKFVGKIKSGGKALGLGALGGAGRLLDRTGSLVTGGRYRWSDLGVKAYKGVAKPAVKAVGNALGLTEEAKMKEQIASYNRRGQHHEAEELQKKLMGKLSHDMEEKYRPDQLADKVASGKFKEFEAAAALSIMASKGHWSLKGKGAGISEIAEHAGLSAEQEYDIREKLEKGGDKQAWLGYDKEARQRGGDAEKQIDGILGTADKAGLNDLFKGVSKGIQVGLDGNTNQTHAAYALSSGAFGANEFDQLNEGTKKEVVSAMTTQAARLMQSGTGEDYAKGIEMMEKMSNFAGKADLQAAMDKNDTKEIEKIQKQMTKFGEKYGASFDANGSVNVDAQYAVGSDKIANNQKSISTQRGKILSRGGDLSHAFPGIDNTGHASEASRRMFSDALSSSTPKDVRVQILANMNPAAMQNDVQKVITQSITTEDLIGVAHTGHAENYNALLSLIDGAQGENIDAIKRDLKSANSQIQAAAKDLETKFSQAAKQVAVGLGALTVGVVSGGTLAPSVGAIAGAVLAGRGVGAVQEENRRKEGGGGGH
jgi:hypothetical protein